VSVDVRQVEAPDELEAALELRSEVFVGEQGVTPEDKDGCDDDATHFVARRRT
jgi:predicted GNAT family N-acyltransferase